MPRNASGAPSVGAVLVLLAGCVGPPGTPPTGTTPAPSEAGRLEVTSSAFPNGGDIPAKYRWSKCATGGVAVPMVPPDPDPDVSPPLSVRRLPNGTRSLALLMDDPDADGFVHWRFWSLPARHADLPEDADVAAWGAHEETNGFGERGYGGPCPPSRHRYVFTFFAVGAERVDGWSAVTEAALAKGELVGHYG